MRRNSRRGRMMTFKITHVAADGRCHKFSVSAPNTASAMAWAEQLYGEARALAVIRITRSPL